MIDKKEEKDSSDVEQLNKKQEDNKQKDRKSQDSDKQKLHNAIWKIANDLRGSIDGWDFKVYVLVTMFYRYLSQHLVNYIKNNYKIDNYEELSDEVALNGKSEIVDGIGYFIAPSELFNNVLSNAKKERELDKDSDLNIILNKVFKNISSSSQGHHSEKNFKGLFNDFDTSNSKLGNDLKQRNIKLLKTLEGVNEMPLGDYTNSSIDAFGDAYEFLISMYASNAGKSGGEYFTPQEVSKLLMKIAMFEHESEENLSIYDPACGSGSLLLQAKRFVRNNDNIKKYCGQEINPTTYNLARMNMFLNDVAYDKFDIELGDTLIDDKFEDQKFDIIVSNPPYSIKWEGKNKSTLSEQDRYKDVGALAPSSKADWAFIQTCLYHLNNNATAAIVCFPGIFTRRGAELEIRKYFVTNNYVDCVIQLPANLFFGTSIPTCVLVLKKNKKDNKVLFINAENEFVKCKNQNKLSDENIDKLYEVYKDRKEIAKFSKLVTINDIEAKDFNLAINAYVDTSKEKENINIDELNEDIKKTVLKTNELRSQIDKIIEELK